MDSAHLFERYRELQEYVGWTADDARRVQSLASLIEPHFPELVDDFYAEIERHPAAAQVITGGTVQVERLKGTLTNWLRELLAGCYNADYVARRWRVGYRHVEIGLDQVYTNVALSRLRRGLIRVAKQNWQGTGDELQQVQNSLNTLLDLDLAIIEDAYQSEYASRREAAERLTSIGQMAGGVAHELRNPLNVINTSVYYLLNAREPSPEKTARHLKRIESQVSLADRVIVTLSNFAKMPLPNLQSISVEPFLNEVADVAEIPENIAVTIDCSDDLPPARGDVDQLRIVFGNLIRNACDAMPDGGQLTLVARLNGEFIDMTVADTGIGIEPDQLGRIMHPLYSTKTWGIGLGLAMARTIVDKNNGHLSVVSSPGQGAAFTVKLPTTR